MAELILPVQHNWQKARSLYQQSIKLGDGYSLEASTRKSAKDKVSVSAIIQSESNLNLILATLESLKGKSPFEWRASPSYPLISYICEEWTITWKSVNLWIFNGVFEEY